MKKRVFNIKNLLNTKDENERSNLSKGEDAVALLEKKSEESEKKIREIRDFLART